jgi:hypothetical protein
MKEVKVIHVVVVLILVLLSVAIFQWANLPKSVPPPEITSSPEVLPPSEFPKLQQNELYNLNAPPSFAEKNYQEELPPFEESPSNDALPPKDPSLSEKATL